MCCGLFLTWRIKWEDKLEKLRDAQVHVALTYSRSGMSVGMQLQLLGIIAQLNGFSLRPLSGIQQAFAIRRKEQPQLRKVYSIAKDTWNMDRLCHRFVQIPDGSRGIMWHRTLKPTFKPDGGIRSIFSRTVQ